MMSVGMMSVRDNLTNEEVTGKDDSRSRTGKGAKGAKSGGGRMCCWVLLVVVWRVKVEGKES